MNLIEASKILKDAGYCLENLPHISDVLDKYHCSKREAMALLEDMSHDAYSSQRIDEYAYDLEYLEK